MRQKRLTFIALLLVTIFLQVPDAAPSILTFTSSTGGSANFTGNSTKFLQVTNSNMNMSESDFSISWWQKTPTLQSLYPRILQFGHGSTYSDKFAISEEDDGNIYLWINGISVTSIPNLITSNWNHIAIERRKSETEVGYDYSWFRNGVHLKTTYFDFVIPEGQLSKWAEYDTSGLDLLIGAGDDSGTGGFTGNIAGVQISQSVRWDPTADFTPPTNFLNPGAGLTFSMYVNESNVVDRSGNELLIMPIATSYGELADDFDPPGVTPDPTPTDPPQTTSAIFMPNETNEWNNQIVIFKTSSSFDYNQITTVAMAIDFSFSVGSQIHESTCYMNLSNKWSVADGANSGENQLVIYLPNFLDFTRSLFPFGCHFADNSDSPYDYLDEFEYSAGIFGENYSDIQFILWTDPNVTDMSYTSNAYENLNLLLNLPPEVTSHAITRGDNSETNPNRISFGDTITVNVTNEPNIVDAVMIFGVPEARTAAALSGSPGNICYYTLDPIDGSELFDRTFSVPTLDEFLIQCRMQYDGEWEFDLTTERIFSLVFRDYSGNFSIADALIILNAPNPILFPEISGHTITRGNNSETDLNMLHSGDIIHFNFVNSSDLSYLGFFILIPEAFGPEYPLSDWNWCYILIEPDSNNVFGENVTVPSAAQISSHCHSEESWYTGDWTFDESIQRRIEINVEDSANNYTRYTAFTLAPQMPTSPINTAPDAPTSVVATTTGKESATVSFAPPGSDGGSVITTYTAVSTPGGITRTLTQAGSGTFTFDNLQPGTSYRFAVTATNAIGTSVQTSSNTITTVAVVVASISSLSFFDDGTGTGGKITWSGKNINSVLYTGPANSYPGPYNYGAFTSGWNGRIRNLMPDTQYTISLYSISVEGIGETKSLTFKTAPALPNSDILETSATKLTKLLKWVEENTYVPGEGRNMSRLLTKFDGLAASPKLSYIKVPTSRVLSVVATSLTPSVCSVVSPTAKTNAGIVSGINSGTCRISYTVSGASRAQATLVKDFVFRKFIK